MEGEEEPPFFFNFVAFYTSPYPLFPNKGGKGEIELTAILMSQRREGGDSAKNNFFQPSYFCPQKAPKELLKRGKRKIIELLSTENKCFWGNPWLPLVVAAFGLPFQETGHVSFFPFFSAKKKYNGKRKCDIFPFPPFQKSKEEGKMFEIGCGISFSARRRGEDMCCAFSAKREGRRRRRPLLLSRYFFPPSVLCMGICQRAHMRF